MAKSATKTIYCYYSR